MFIKSVPQSGMTISQAIERQCIERIEPGCYRASGCGSENFDTGAEALVGYHASQLRFEAKRDAEALSVWRSASLKAIRDGDTVTIMENGKPERTMTIREYRQTVFDMPDHVCLSRSQID